MPAIEARELVKEFGGVRVVDRVNIAIESGEIYGFLGPNGAGKTTTLRMLTGLLTPTSGNAIVGGADVTKEPERVKGLIGYMAQSFGLYRDLTVEENLYFYGRLYLSNSDAIRRQGELIDRMGLQRYRGSLARELSGGWRQRLAIGCSLLHEPKILFLDEPTAGIDPVSRRDLWDILYELVLEGMTLFVTTHYMEEAERCNRIGFIARGQVLASDTPRALKSDYLKGAILAIRGAGLHAEREAESGAGGPSFKTGQASGEASSLAATGNLAAANLPDLHVRLRKTFPQSTLYGNEIHLLFEDPDGARPGLEKAIRDAGVTEFLIEEIEPSIEDVFVHLTRGLVA